jgi:hypothetical protein
MKWEEFPDEFPTADVIKIFPKLLRGGAADEDAVLTYFNAAGFAAGHWGFGDAGNGVIPPQRDVALAQAWSDEELARQIESHGATAAKGEGGVEGAQHGLFGGGGGLFGAIITAALKRLGPLVIDAITKKILGG